MEDRAPLTARHTILCGQKLLASETEGPGRCQVRGAGVLGLVKTKHKENGSSESHLGSHMPLPIIRVLTTCTACRRWLRTKVETLSKIDLNQSLGLNETNF